MSDFLTFRGWAFPSIPLRASVAFSSGSVAMPAAGAGGNPFAAYVDGYGELGGTGYLFASRLLSGPYRQAAIIGLGFGVRDAQRTMGFPIPLGAGLNVPIMAALATDWGTIPANAIAYKYLALNADVTTALRDGSNNQVGVFGGALGPLYLEDGVISSSWNVLDTGGGGNVYVHLSEESELARDFVVMDLVLRPISEGGVVGSVGMERNPLGIMADVRPQLLQDRQRPELMPVSPASGRGAFLDAATCATVGVIQQANGPVPQSAYACAEMAVAIWS